MGGARENKKTKENLRMFMGRRKHIVKNKGDFSGYMKKNPYLLISFSDLNWKKVRNM